MATTQIDPTPETLKLKPHPKTLNPQTLTPKSLQIPCSTLMDPFKGTLKVLKGPGPGTESLPGDALRRKAPDLPTELLGWDLFF